LVVIFLADFLGIARARSASRANQPIRHAIVEFIIRVTASHIQLEIPLRAKGRAVGATVSTIRIVMAIGKAAWHRLQLWYRDGRQGVELRQLNYFVRVIELRSFTKAAEALHISQPAIGEQIKNLEDELSASLLIRHSRGVEPTETGRMLFKRARAILQQVAETREAVRDYEQGMRGRVTLGLTIGLAESVAAAMIERCSREYPSVVIHVMEDLSTSLVKRVTSRGSALSFAVVSGYELPATQDVLSRHLLKQDLYAVGSTRTIGSTNDPLPFHELAQFRLILPGDGTRAPRGLLTQLEAIAQSEDISLMVAYEIQAISLIKQLVERDVGVAVLPAGTVSEGVRDGRLAARRIVGPSVSRELHVVWSAHRVLTAAEEKVRDMLSEMIVENRARIED
jgi:LysR family nitrogen assimilation transcriptional regulator